MKLYALAISTLFGLVLLMRATMIDVLTSNEVIKKNNSALTIKVVTYFIAALLLIKPLICVMRAVKRINDIEPN